MSLVIKLDANLIDDDGLNTISYLLLNYTSLESLTLDLRNNNITKNGIIKLMDTVNNLKNLFFLKIHFDSEIEEQTREMFIKFTNLLTEFTVNPYGSDQAQRIIKSFTASSSGIINEIEVYRKYVKTGMPYVVMLFEGNQEDNIKSLSVNRYTLYYELQSNFVYSTIRQPHHYC